MDETKSFSTATDIVTLPNLPQQRHSAEVPRDDDEFFMEHLNDPNFDLRHPSHAGSIESLSHKKHFSGAVSDLDTESHFGSEGRSASRAESRDSTAIDFDECVPTYSRESFTDRPAYLASLHILKSEPQWRASMTHLCQ
jgi:hypothetical protein